MFQKIIDLKDKMEKDKKKRLGLQNSPIREDFERRAERKDLWKKEPEGKESNSFSASSAVSRAQAIDKVYSINNKDEAKNKNELQKISRPAAREPFFTKTRLLYAVLFGLAVVLTISLYFNFQNFRASRAPVDAANQEARWYLVKLVNGDIFYGKIADIKSDPIVLSVVYYDYDQLNKEKNSALSEKQESGNLRLVKRGKEMHGPDGTLSLIRSQVVFLEPLADNSKVLKAILENEK